MTTATANLHSPPFDRLECLRSSAAVPLFALPIPLALSSSSDSNSDSDSDDDSHNAPHKNNCTDSSSSQASSARTSMSDSPQLLPPGKPALPDSDQQRAKNPYLDLIRQCPTPQDMAKAYETHRRTRNAEKLRQLSHTRTVTPDSILAGLVLHNQPPESDPRNNITVWGRPTRAVMDLVAHVQQQLLDALSECIPSLHKQTPPIQADEPTNKGPLWLMPQECLHLSALEITHSVPPHVIESQIRQLQPFLDSMLSAARGQHAPVLVKPLVCFDSAALALTFVPLASPLQQYGPGAEKYTYTHLRAHLYDAVHYDAQINNGARYEVPSAHVTIARFIEEVSPDAVDALLARIARINDWLEKTYATPESFSWQVGAERGTECRCGRIWYGGGWTEATGATVK